MLQAVLVGPVGKKFIKEAKSYDRQIFAWTVNDEKRMRWCINSELDGVISDDPEKFLEVCKDYGSTAVREQTRTALRKKEAFKVRDWYDILRIQFFVAIFLVLFKWKFGSRVETRFVRRPVVLPPLEKK
jgi:phosphatidylglycerol phospholipase C